MSRITTHFTILFLCCIYLSGNAQVAPQGNVLWLKTGQKNLPETFDFSYQTSSLINGKFYRYLQFYHLPDATEKQLLQHAGVELLEYIPNNTYLAAIPATLNFNELNTLDIRSLSPIAPEDKIDPGIDRNNRSPQNFFIQFQKNISEEQGRCFLENNGIEITGSFLGNKAFPITTTFELAERLVTFDLVLFLEKHSGLIRPEAHQGNVQHRSNTLATYFPTGRHFDGTGINIAIGDDGFVGPHIDFEGRIIENNFQEISQNNHGDMVAGILAGAGNFDPNIEGIAKGANLFVFKDFKAVENAAQLYQEQEVVITSTSYGDGCNRGYTTFTQLADFQTIENPALMHVFSAGNSGDQDCEYGAGAGWGNITGGVKVGKNVLAVGNLDHNDELVFNSSRGPSNDGRIKPDICAIGEGQISTAPNNEFQISSGSSAAAPVISGILAQLYHAYRTIHDGLYPPSALIKAILLNSADDLGHPGPDYAHGWGKANAWRAVRTLENENYFSGFIGQDQELSFQLNIPIEVAEVKVMLYWHDKEGSTVSEKSLVNDLDFYIQNNNGLHRPWSLNPNPDPQTLALPAGTGDDHINNMEQVVIANPDAGIHSIKVQGYQIPFETQEFYIVYEYIFDDVQLTYPFGNEKLIPGESIRIHWDSGINTGDFNLEFSADNGQLWNPIATVAGYKRFYDWVLPELYTSGAKIRISRNEFTSENEVPFHLYDIPQGFQVTQVCPDYVHLKWDTLPGAVHYTIHSLKSKYMDSITTAVNTNINIPITNPLEDHWFAIAATHENGAQSQRTIAIMAENNLLECELQNDLKLVNFSQPATNIIQDCFDDFIQVAVNIKNEGTLSRSGFSLYYQYDNFPPVVQVYPGIIPPGLTVNFGFQTLQSLGEPGEHSLKVWIEATEEQAIYNDSLELSMLVNAGSMAALPYFQNFDNFQNCIAGDNSCGSLCALQEGWTNADNSNSDDIDWRINSGSTPTQGTGPEKDQNGNDDFGNYLYLEGSPACLNSEAILYTPCIDLSNSSEPLLSFWYHMSGSEMGNLHLDLFDGNTWYNNIMTPLYGNQGSEWQKAEIDLSSFSGSMINLRFRGFTGNGFLTDLAIDNFSVVETAGSPIADFILEKHLICSDQPVQLIDNSYNDPQAWEWSIEPAGYSFANGSSIHSANPVVVFETTGLYSISLTASNSYGEDEHIKYDILVVSDGLEIPYVESFDEIVFPNFDWKIENQDLNKSWELIRVPGKSGEETDAVYVNNHSYNAINQEDALVSKVIDLSNAQNPFLRFDYSYAPFSQNFSDNFRVELSTDCQTTFGEILFNKGGQALATAPIQMTGWTPLHPSEWKTEIIDLSNYVGSKVALKFINVCGFGNNLYLDNIRVYEYEDYPRPDFGFLPDVAEYCVGETIAFENLSEGNNLLSYEWSFGPAADPGEAASEGPHLVTFDAVGTYDISLKAFNAIGWDEKIKTITVIDQPIADFSYTTNDGTTLSFFNESVYGISFLWDFGDGFFSDAENPVHTFAEGTAITISLLVKNRCGENKVIKNFVPTSLSEVGQSFSINIQPNPASAYLNVEGFSRETGALGYSLYDISGKAVLQKSVQTQSGKFFQTFDISSLPSGIYLLSIQADHQTLTRKIAIF